MDFKEANEILLHDDINPLLKVQWENTDLQTAKEFAKMADTKEDIEDVMTQVVIAEYSDIIIDALTDFKEFQELDCTIEELKETLKRDWGEGGDKGFAFFVADDMPLEHIEKIDELDIFDDDLEASAYAELIGVKIAHDIVFDDEDSPYYYYNGTILDTEENRRLYEQMKAEGDV